MIILVDKIFNIMSSNGIIIYEWNIKYDIYI